MPQTIVQQAQAIATQAHSGQVDKTGAPYTGHVERVAANLQRLFPRLGEAFVAAAWLHDVVEDSVVTLDDLRAAGFPELTVAAVDAVSKRKDEPTTVYFTRIRATHGAKYVKVSDWLDNTDPGRLAGLDAETRQRLRWKYSQAFELLSEGDDELRAHPEFYSRWQGLQ